MNTKEYIIFGGKKAKPQMLTCLDYFSPCWAEVTVIYDHALCEESLRNSLIKALSHMPYISGRIKAGKSREPMLTAEDEGVLFKTINYEEIIPCFTSCKGNHFDRLHNTLSQIDPQSLNDENTPVVQILLSNYQNASILTIFINHLVFDFLSVANFLKNWSKLARKVTPEPLIFDRDLLRQTAIGLGDSYPHPIMPVIEEELCPYVKMDIPCIRRTMRLKAATLRKWVEASSEHNISQKGIKYCLLPAHILKITQKFRKIKDDSIGYVQLNNLRSILGLSHYYFGNVIEGTSFEIDHIELSKMPVEEVAKKIWSLRDILANAPDVAGKAVAFWENKMRNGQLDKYLRKSFNVLCDRGDLQFNDISKVSLYDVDFGSGVPIWQEVPLISSSFPGRVCIILSAPERNGDLILHAVFPENEMDELCKHFLPVPGS